MVRRTLKILQEMLEDFYSVSDHSGTVCMKGLIQLRLIDRLPHFWPMFSFYTSWKHHKTFVFLVISSEYKMGTLAKYGLNCNNTFTVIILFFSLVSSITYVSSTHRQRHTHTYTHTYINTSLVFLDTKLRVLKSLKR